MHNKGAMSQTRRNFFRTTAAGGLAAAAVPSAAQAQANEPEWRNRQAGMHYRRLGRTGLMISEVVSGGDPIRSDNWEHLGMAVERGLNYLDMAPQYGNGDCEIAYGKFLAGQSSRREKVFLTTKVSRYTGVRNRMYKEIYDGLGPAKQAEYQRKSEEMMRERGVSKPGYFFEYFPGQLRGFKATYVSNAMMADYGHKVEGSDEFREFIVESVEGSLKRVGTDYFDNLMCPHGAASPEELEHPQIIETFQQLKKAGKVRNLGFTAHNDPGGVLEKAAELGYFDLAMVAYNVVNGGYVEAAIRKARAKDMGVVAMKSAMAVATHHKALQPTPQWRIDKVHRLVPGDMKSPLKAYTWSLQNPGIAAVISNLWDEQFIEENLSVAGQKVELAAG